MNLLKEVSFTYLFCFILASISYGQETSMEYYLPSGYTYDPKVPTPASHLGFEVGEWHASHDQVVSYFRSLAASSDRLSLIEYGKSYEMRPLVMLVVTSPSNQSDLETIKSNRSGLRNGQTFDQSQEIPLVMYMGHTVHGNEPSGVQASLLTAYHFAAANEVGEDLDNIVLLIDPVLNPDGMNRFSSWVNMHKSYHPNGDKNNRELNEAWPGGRTNHYWFDLNRDWLPVQHPESRGRITQIQEWIPNVVLDFHEMGTDNTYFFQPGIPSRNHPLTPQKNFEITERIAQYHAKFLDEIGSLYYSQESFDDFYYGKGSTYPDIQGAIGILFEQASSRGHVQENVYGKITFPFTIRNQVRTTLSSFQAIKEMGQELNKYMVDFYREAKEESESDSNKAFIFGNNDDYARSYHLADILLHHDIEVYELKEDVMVNGVPFGANKAFIVPFNQPQYRLIKSMFETRTSFQDSLFYDVSAWTLPMAFNLDHMALSSRIFNLANVEEVEKGFPMRKGRIMGSVGANSYAFEWHGYYAPKAAYGLMDKGYQVRVSHEPFETDLGINFRRGSVLVEKGNAGVSDQEFYEDLQLAAEECGLTIHAMGTGYTSGINLGSPSIDVLKKPEVAILVDRGASSSDAGEIWHLFDQRLEIPLTLMPMDRFANADLNRYNLLILPSGSYNSLGKSGAEKLKNWVNQGGTIIARGSAMIWLSQQELANYSWKTSDKDEEIPQKAYADLERERGARVTGGAIFKGKLDITHPLGYGYSDSSIFLFKNGNQFLKPSSNSYANPLLYTDDPLASGYIHPSNLDKLKDSGMIQVVTQGQGRIIGFVDNPNFRAFWFGTNKLFLNAVFFGQTINPQSGR
ncbi:M14 family metallopeptidase [Pleomorphovibrio marinus]|uniref:M14 family metallopeptidase n=1 Tax=Pleomorphovibrio marinus TaxID=2164132 RepID=UPI000E0BD19E|nr:M14 family metallopeptidase [Pleomorphovibrio marinus]